MPSVLAEISFVSHPQEGALLKTGGYRQKIAEALFDAVMTYQRSLKTLGTSARSTSNHRVSPLMNCWVLLARSESPVRCGADIDKPARPSDHEIRPYTKWKSS